MPRFLWTLWVALAGGCVGGATVLGADAAVDGGPIGACERAPRPDLAFERHVLETAFYGEAIGALDVDEDGAVDLVTLPYWWSGPDFTARHEVTTPFAPLDPATEYGSTYGVYPWDVDEDGCTDVVIPSREIDPQMFWWRNPPRAGGGCGDPDAHWEAFGILGSEDDGTIEGPIVAELAPGRPALVMGRGVAGREADGATLGWWAPGTDPRAPWEFHAISGRASRSAQAWTHGLGVGDLNGDRRADVLTPFAWFEQPVDSTISPWPEHPFPDAFRAGIDEYRVCSSMRVHDVDDDGAPDVICARPHDYGLWWWHQIAVAGGGTTFEALLADGTTLPAMHAVVLADLDGEGVPEIVTGERYLAHPAPDPPPPRLVYYTLCRDAAGPHFAPHPIDGDSGVGVQFVVADLDGDTRPDVAVAGKRGVFYFLRR